MVEHDLAKVGVEGPSPFSRSKKKEKPPIRWLSFFIARSELGLDPEGSRGRLNNELREARANYLGTHALKGGRPVRAASQPSKARGLAQLSIPFPYTPNHIIWLMHEVRRD